LKRRRRLEEVVEEVAAEANFSMRAVRTGEAIGPGVRQQYARSSSTVKRVAVAEKSMAQLHLPKKVSVAGPDCEFINN